MDDAAKRHAHYMFNKTSSSQPTEPKHEQTQKGYAGQNALCSNAPVQEIAQLVNSFLNSQCARDKAESESGSHTSNNASSSTILASMSSGTNLKNVGATNNESNGTNAHVYDLKNATGSRNLASVSSATNLMNKAPNLEELNNTNNVHDMNDHIIANNEQNIQNTIHFSSNANNPNNVVNGNDTNSASSAQNCKTVSTPHRTQTTKNMGNSNNFNSVENLYNGSTVHSAGTPKNNGVHHTGHGGQPAAQPRTTGHSNRQAPVAFKRPQQLMFLVPAMTYNNDRRIPTTHATRSRSTSHNTPTGSSNGDQKKRGSRRKDEDKPKGSPSVFQACAPRRKMSDPVFPLPKVCALDGENTPFWSAGWTTLTNPTVRKTPDGAKSKLQPGSRFDVRLLLGSIVNIGMMTSRTNSTPVEYGIHLDVSSGVYYECRQPLKTFSPQMPRIGDVLSIVYHKDRSLSFEKNFHTIGTVESPKIPKESSASPCDIDWQPFVNTCVDAKVTLN